MNRKPGQLIEIFGDFWLGMAGAAATGLSEFSKKRREDKQKENDSEDFFSRASEALMSAAHEATAVAHSTTEELHKQES